MSGVANPPVRHWFLRHAPVPEAAGLCYGRIDYVPGEIAVAEAVRALRGRLPEAPLLSSPARRCLALARAIARDAASAAPTADVACDPRLREIDFGDWEGHAWDALPRAALDAWAADVAGFRPPRGETFLELIARVRSLLDTLSRPHLLVTHAGVVRAAWHLRGGLPIDRAAAMRVPYLVPIAIG